MHRRRAVVALALAGALLAPPATATPAPGGSVTHGAPELPPHVLTWLETVRRLGLPPPDVRAEDETIEISGTFAFAEPARDLDGDGTPDVYGIVIDFVFRVDFGPVPTLILAEIEFEGHTVVDVLSGRDGRRLWRAEYDDFVIPVDARVGQNARNGTILLHGIGTMLGPVEERDITVSAHAGRTGRQLWERRYRTYIVDRYPTFFATGAPFVVEIFDGAPGDADDILIGLADVASTGFSYVAVGETRVIDGTDGAESVHPTRDVGVNWLPVPWAVSDLDGDGLDDYVVTNENVVIPRGDGVPETGDGVFARRGIDGGDVWARGNYRFQDLAWVYPLRDTTGSGRGDMGIATLAPQGWRLTTYLVDGLDGTARWERPGGWPHSPGDIGRGPHPDVVTADPGVNFEKRVAYMRLGAYDARGAQLWKRRHNSRFGAAPQCLDICFSFVGIGWDGAGDVDRDGISDTWVRIHASHDPGDEWWFFYTVSNRTGRRDHLGGKERFALRTSLDESGTDLVEVTPGAKELEVAARDGDSGNALWRTTVSLDMPMPPKKTDVWVDGTPHGAPCGAALVTVATPKRAVLLVLDAHGRLIWHRTLLGGSVEAGTTARTNHNGAC